MAGEFKLSYTGQEIDEKLNKIDSAVLYGRAQSLTEAQKAQARVNIAALGKSDISLGIASDGLIYIFVNGEPVGTGIPQGQSGDVFGYVDENNTIVLNGNLADGTYTVKYEMEDGSTVDIGELSLGEEPITNLAGTISVGRLGSDGTIRNDTDACRVTDFVAVKKGDVVRVKGLCFVINDIAPNTMPSAVYNSSKSKLSSVALANGDTSYYTVQETTGNGATITIISDSVAYSRFSGYPTGADEDIIVTVNQEIE